MKGEVSVLNNTKGKLPSLPFVLIKEKILGKNYSLSVAFINKTQSKRINNKYRKKNNPTNILSFPLSKKEGEILICPEVAKNETKKFNKNFKELLILLFIHGCLHLKGLNHGEKMEKLEEKYLSQYMALAKKY